MHCHLRPRTPPVLLGFNHQVHIAPAYSSKIEQSAAELLGHPTIVARSNGQSAKLEARELYIQV